mgnify:CR=1 FL=1
MGENREGKKQKGNFIAFEGIDGSGKSTQIGLLAERLKKEGVCCYTTMEPTNAPVGSLVRQVMTGRIRMDNKAIAALFAADRLDHLLNEVDGIASKIEEGTTVLTDRYYFSSYGVTIPFISFSPCPNFSTGVLDLSLMLGCVHLHLYFSGSGRASQRTAMLGSYLQAQHAISNSVRIWCLSMG